MRIHSGREENILPPLERSKPLNDSERHLNKTNSTSTLKFKSLENTVWNHNGKDLIKRDETTQLDRRLNTDTVTPFSHRNLRSTTLPNI